MNMLESKEDAIEKEDLMSVPDDILDSLLHLLAMGKGMKFIADSAYKIIREGTEGYLPFIEVAALFLNAKIDEINRIMEKLDKRFNIYGLEPIITEKRRRKEALETS